MDRSRNSLAEKRVVEKYTRRKRKTEKLNNDRELNIFYDTSRLQSDISVVREKLHTVIVIGQPEITSVEMLGELCNLRELWIVECSLKDVTPLSKYTSLEKLYLYSNEIREMPDFSAMERLVVLSIARNKISNLGGLRGLIVLRDLNVADNEICKIRDVFSSECELQHINFSGNPLADLQDVENLGLLKKLESIEFDDPVYGGCPLVETHFDHRQYLVRLLPSLQKIDCYPIGSEERKNSRTLEISFNEKILQKHFCDGSLDKNFFANFLNSREFLHVRHLAIVDCSISQEHLPGISLPQLVSLDLSRNLIESLQGLGTLKRLRTLCVSRNKLGAREKDFGISDSEVMKLSSIVILYADNNQIRSIADAGFPKMPNLEYIFLQGNLLADLNGMQDFPNLTTAVLDNNKLEFVDTDEFSCNVNLRTLFLENNKLSDLKFAKKLGNVEKLFLANNQITDENQLVHLRGLGNLKELTIHGNPCCTGGNIYREFSETIKFIDGRENT